MYLQKPKTGIGELPNQNLRTLQGMKANYGERGGKIELEWKNGLFVPVTVAGGFDKLAAEQKADDLFLSLVARFEREGRDVSPNPGPTYAPAVFATHTDAAGMTKAALRAAMDRLLRAAKIEIKQFGSPSHRRSRLILSNKEAGNA